MCWKLDDRRLFIIIRILCSFPRWNDKFSVFRGVAEFRGRNENSARGAQFSVPRKNEGPAYQFKFCDNPQISYSREAWIVSVMAVGVARKKFYRFLCEKQSFFENFCRKSKFFKISPDFENVLYLPLPTPMVSGIFREATWQPYL